MLDHKLLDVQLRQSEAAVEQSEAQLRLLQSGARKEDINIAEKQVQLAQINLQQAEEDKDRFAKLMETNTITRKQYDDVVTKFDQASNQLNTARENLQKARTIIRPEEIESAQANLKRSKAGVDLIRKNIDDCTITAPISGTVTKKFSEAGEYVTPGASLLSIADLSAVDLKIYVTGEELGKVKIGQKAEVITDSFKDKKYIGEIIFISSEAEFTPKNIQTKEERTKLVYAVKIRIPNPERELKSGMPADVNIRLN
jgi:HlyD family secretion protein